MDIVMPKARVIQNCYLVRDLEAACGLFHRLYGMGPFLGGSPSSLDNHVYRGKPAGGISMKGVFGHTGDLNVELVQMLSDEPSAFTEEPLRGDIQLHHVAVFCDDYARERDAFVAAGFPVASEFTVSFGAQICYVDTRAAFGHYIELYPENATIRGMYRQARDAWEQWDGGGALIRPWG